MQRLLHFFSTQYGQQVHAVLGGVGREVGAEDAGAGGHDVGEHDGFVAARAGFNLPRPAHDERHAMAALEGVGLPAPPVDVEMHARRVELREVRLGRGAVVAGENDHRVAGLAGVVQRLQKFADSPVGFHEKIGVVADVGFALEAFARCDRRVRRGHGEVEEERLLVSLAAADILGAALGVLGQHGGEIPVRHRRSGGDADHRALFHLCGGFTEQTIVFVPRVGRPVGYVIAEIVVKAVTVRPARDRFCEIDLCQVLRGAAALLRPMPAKMPFADHASVVALGLEQFRQSEARIANERSLPLADDAALEPAAPIVTARQQSISRGRANAGGRMGVHEAHAPAGQAVDGRCLEPHLWVECRDGINPHVVAKDDDDVGSLRRGHRGGC